MLTTQIAKSMRCQRNEQRWEYVKNVMLKYVKNVMLTKKTTPERCLHHITVWYDAQAQLELRLATCARNGSP